jgi:alpha-L-rhamnosidase
MKTIRVLICAAHCLMAGLACSHAEPVPAGGPAGSLCPDQLCCEGRANPLGIDSGAPRLSWVLKAGAPNARGLRQTAYQILVATTPAFLAKDRGDIWDSGKIDSDATSQITFKGMPLTSSQRVFWKVRVWDQAGQSSAWSAPALWTMGVLNSSDWGMAKWIGAPDGAPVNIKGPKAKYETVLLRREFVVKPGLRRALAHVCGLGQYEMTLNGAKVGDDLFTPGWTKYDKTCLYDTRDITAQLRAGKNATGLFLDNGMYLSHKGRYIKENGWSFGPLQAIASIRLEYSDGSVETLVTDDKWRAASGPITFSSPYGGEDYNAQLEPKDWNKPGFDDSKWAAARVTGGPGGKLAGLSCAASPIRTFDVLKPVSKKELKQGVTVYDLGQNVSLMPRISVRGPAGSSVKIVPSELVKESGEIDDTMCGGGAYWTYTLTGGVTERWFPRFFYRGARYLQVECIPAGGKGEAPKLESIEGVVVHSSSSPVGEFSCSSDLFNRIHTLVRWAQRSNMMSVLTDCPTREKLGWLEQYHLNGPSLRYAFDLDAVFAKGMNDMADCQLDSGLVPNIAPEYEAFGGANRNAFGDSPEWSSAFLLVAWQQYEFTGDTGLLRSHYDAMKKYVAYLDERAKDGIVDYGLGDWYDIGPGHPGFAQLTPKALTATAFYYYDTWIVSQVARLLGKQDDATLFSGQAEKIRDAFNQKFFDARTNQYATGSQCANSIPLVMNIAEPDKRRAVLENIVKDVRGKGLTAGDVGYRYLLRALADGGRSDVIYELNNQSDKPGYGMQLAKGATSLTEAWDANRGPSQNHFMLGQINEWLYHDLVGIQSDPSAPGFRKIIIRPAVVGNLESAKASYISVRGEIQVAWKRSGPALYLRVVIPPNTTATVFVPAKGQGGVTESGRPAQSAPGVKFLKKEGECAVFEIASGSYTFRS